MNSKLFGLFAFGVLALLLVAGMASAAVDETQLCEYDNGGLNASVNTGYLTVDLKSNDINVINGLGEDDAWLPFDEIEVEVEIKNNGLSNYDIDDIVVEWALVSDSTNLSNTTETEWLFEFDEIDEINLKEDDEEAFVFTFMVDEDDLEGGLEDFGGSWNLVVRATGIIDSDGGLAVEDTCAVAQQSVSIEEDDAVVLTNIEVPETLQCGQTYTITAEAWNIGDGDEDEVTLSVRDRDRLFINEVLELGDFSDFDDVDVSFNLEIPADAEEKIYSLILEVLDEDNDVYEIGSEDAETVYSVTFEVSGNCVGPASPVTVTANLVSDAKAGQDLVVKASVVNTGSNSATYTLNSGGHSAWASSYTVEPSTLTLAAGQSGEATFTFKVNKNAAGEQTFNIEIVSGNQVTTQPVSVMIESSGFLGSITGGAVSDNAWVWGLGALNILLIVVIVLVAVRVMRK